MEFESGAERARMHLGRQWRHQGRLQVEHAPGASTLVQRHAIVDFAGVDRDGVAWARFHNPPAAGRFLRTPLDHAEAELQVHVPAEDEAGVGLHRFDAGQCGGQESEGFLLHGARPLGGAGP